MPNWCFTSYVIDGKRKEVQSLFSKMNNLEKRRKPLVDNGFGKQWLGCLVTKLGADWQKVYCRGSWDNLHYEGGTLTFSTETAYGPMNEVFKLIKDIHPSLQIYYCAEEDGWGYYATNDTQGVHFPERFKVESEWETEYPTSIEDACSCVSKLIGKEVKTREELEMAIEEWNDNLSMDDDDKRIYFHEYKVEENEYL